jgi:hypothetical protein
MSKRFNYSIQTTAGNIFSTSGNVGIGTTNPGERLSVIGNLQVGGNTQSNYISFYGTNGDNPSGFNHSYIGERIYGGTERSELLLFKGNDPDSTSGQDRIRLLSAEHRFDTYTSSLSGTFDGIGTSGTTRMTILNSGNIGIGTTTPSNILDIRGDPIFDDLELYPNRNSNNSYPLLQLSSNQFTGQTIGTIYSKIATRSWKGSSSGEFANDDVWIQVERQDITNPGNNFTHDAGLVIYTNSNNRDNQPTKRITINQNGLIVNSGSIGIGTTAPAFTLDVVGTARFSSGLTTGTLTATSSTVPNAVSTNISSGTLTATTLVTSVNLSGLNVTAGTLSATTLVSSANVTANLITTGTLRATNIISTTSTIGAITGFILNSPYPSLPSTTNFGCYFEYNHPTTNIYIGDGTGYGLNFNKRIGNSTTSLLHIRDNGNVGIGTASPRGIFDINSTSDIYLTANTTSGSSQSTYMNGHVWFAPYTGSNIAYLQARRGDSSGTTEFQFRTYTAGNLSESIRIAGNGNVGIGTQSPAYPLDVQLSTAVTTGSFLNLNNPFPFGAHNGGGIGSAISFSSRWQGDGLTGIVEMARIDARKENPSNYGDSYITLSTRYDTTRTGQAGSLFERMRISGLGYVGIGTNNPTSLLHTKVESGNNYLTIQGIDAGQAALQFSGSTAKWTIYKPASGNDLRFYNHNYSIDSLTLTSVGNLAVPLGTGINFNSAGTQNNSSYALYAIASGNYAIRLVGDQDGSFTRPFEIGHFTGNNPASTWNVRFSANSYNGNVYAAGNVGIGTTGPSSIFQIGNPTDNIASGIILGNNTVSIFGPARTNPSPSGIDDHTATMYLSSTDAYEYNRGASLALGGRTAGFLNTINSHSTFARISGVANGFTGNFVIETYDGSKLREKMRILGSSGLGMNTVYVGIGTSTPVFTLDVNGTARVSTGITTGTLNATTLDIQTETRSGTHASSAPLYVTGNIGESSSGVEIRHTNGTQGVGIGYNTVYAAGSNTNQDLGLKSKGTGSVLVTGGLKIGSSGTKIETVLSSLVSNTGSTEYTVNFGYTFTSKPSVNINLEGGNTAFVFLAQLLTVTTTGFTYRVLAFTINNPSHCFAASDGHTIHWTARGT